MSQAVIALTCRSIDAQTRGNGLGSNTEMAARRPAAVNDTHVIVNAENFLSA
jgi:hypothetical protein